VATMPIPVTSELIVVATMPAIVATMPMSVTIPVGRTITSSRGFAASKGGGRHHNEKDQKQTYQQDASGHQV